MLNHITIMGRLTADPELKTTTNGVPTTAVTLAVDRDFKNKQTGERETDFIRVIAWRQTAEFICRYFAKGRMAVADGRLQVRNYTDRDGNKRTAVEVVADNVYFGDSKRDEKQSGEWAPYPANAGPDAYAEFGGSDDIPF